MLLFARVDGVLIHADNAGCHILMARLPLVVGERFYDFRSGRLHFAEVRRWRVDHAYGKLVR